MKKTFLLIALCLFSVLSYAQQSEIPKAVNKTIIANTKTALENFMFAKEILAKKGIAIAISDKDVLQISSGTFVVDNSVYFLIIYCKNNQLEITCNSGNIYTGYSVLVNKPPFIKSFSKLNEYLKVFGTNFKYETE